MKLYQVRHIQQKVATGTPGPVPAQQAAGPPEPPNLYRLELTASHSIAIGATTRTE
ncbi:hypothetical protein [Kamptonema formosum]|uniref:hypothetical protein n=1 Tax=Kamptonema formosum TaxID=331992 RepID=UPI00034B19B4|nr:hypothetical protein [Oscillatoria sp. PCC 10802]